jgi:hypothetical protein
MSAYVHSWIYKTARNNHIWSVTAVLFQTWDIFHFLQEKFPFTYTSVQSSEVWQKKLIKQHKQAESKNFYHTFYTEHIKLKNQRLSKRNHVCSLVVRVPGQRSRFDSGATRFSEKLWVWNGVHSASWVQLRSYLKEKVAARV